MKKKMHYLLFLLLTLLYTGCTHNGDVIVPTSTPQPAVTASPTPSPAPTVAPDWQNEEQTIYKLPLALDSASYPTLYCWNEQLLVKDDRENLPTQLYTVDMNTGEKLVTSHLHLWEYNIPFITDEGILYLKNDSKSLMLLNDDLSLKEDILLPANLEQEPVLDSAGNFYYYADSNASVWKCSLHGNQCTKLNSNLLPNGIYAEQTFFGGQILSVFGEQEQHTSLGSVFCTEYLDTETGEPIRTLQTPVQIATGKDNFQALLSNNTFNQLLFGTRSSESVSELILPHSDEYSCVKLLPEENLVLTVYIVWDETSSDYGRIFLAAYDLKNGKKTFSSSFFAPKDSDGIPASPMPPVYFPQSRKVFLQVISPQDTTILCWDLNAQNSACTEDTIYTGRYVPQAEMKDDGLIGLRKTALDMGRHYNVKIYLGDDCDSRGGYEITPLYHPRLVSQALDTLDECLKSYPTDFFEQLTKNNKEPLHIYITSTLTPVIEEGISTAAGFYESSEYAQCLVLDGANWGSLKGTFFHEISHAIDYYLYGDTFNWESSPEWDALNPDGFSYDNTYTIYENTGGDFSNTFGGDNACFIDSYSKTFCTEDRARITEYAMTYPENGYFESGALKEKLLLRCEEIRKGFDTTDWPEVTTWEIPLTQ